MKQFLFTKFLRFLEKLTGKKIVYFPKDRGAVNLTAVKSDLGFWYAGNVLDMSDIAYGVLYNGLIERQGSYLVINILQNLLKNKNRLTFYDIGANTGYFGILAAYKGLPDKIFTYAFEPVAEFNKIQLEALKLNRLENLCRIFNIALGDKSEKMDIFLAGSGTSLRKDFLGAKNLPKRRIEVKILDEVIRQENLMPPDFIKIDVEGHELAVLKGAEKILRENKPVVWYESALIVKTSKFINKEFFKTQEFLKKIGYEIFFCGSDISPVNKVNVPEGVAMYLALHTLVHKDILFKLQELYGHS